ncbi:MAG: hypothetical protein KC425_23580, partial [Anaerolineales bacterium]|nr:hypothetical protein [Anaerolineales bacterium]
MAQLIPNTPIHGSPPEIIRLFQVFKRLPDPIVVLQRLPAVHGPGPDFCLLQDERAILLAVSCATPHEAQLTQQPGLFENGGVSLGQAEATRLAEFVAGETAVARLPTAILFPNLSDKQLQALPGSGVGGAWVGKERLAPGQFHAWLQTQLTASLPGAPIDRLRQRFTPEVVVPAAFTVRRPRARHTGAELTPYLLDYDQEQVLKMDLNLPDAGLKTARAFQLRLVNGVAGSGKSLIVIYRAHLLRQLFPQKRILILTHNRALRHDLWRRYARLSQGDRGVRVQTFMGWCRKQWPPDRPWHDIISHRDRVALARQAWLAHLRDTAVSEQMLLDEIDWYKDRLV